MKVTSILWDMPITIEIIDKNAKVKDFKKVFDYFIHIDNTFSTFNPKSEITKINQKALNKEKWSPEMKEVFRLAEKTKKETEGYFNIFRNGIYDPLGIVKGWAIKNASDSLKTKGYKNFYIDAGGDIQVHGKNAEKKNWRIGIKNPFNIRENVKVLKIHNKGIATSGTYLRGQHVQNPHLPKEKIIDIVSLTVIGPDVCEADRFATAAFAMGIQGINFIEKQKDLEGYMIHKDGIATYTTNFNKYVL